MSRFGDKTVLIRADASHDIGTGHVMRTLVFAEKLKNAGAEVVFATREHPGHMINFIRQKGFTVHNLQAPEIQFHAQDYASWLGADGPRDLEETFGDQRYDLVVTDHYGVDIEWQRKAKEKCGALICFDDEATQDFDCDIILNQNFFLKEGQLYSGSEAKKLIGAKYAILRDDFRCWRQKTKPRVKLDRLLLMLGGTNASGMNEKLVKAIEAPLTVTVVVGFGYKNSDQLKKICKEKEFRFLQSVDNIAELMGEADLCVGAGGTTSYERCCMMLPSVVLVLAKNQEKIVKNLNDFGALLNLGEVSDYWAPDINKTLNYFIQNPDALSQMSVVAAELVDGKGIDRVMAEAEKVI